MKKLVITTAVVLTAAVAAYSQGVVSFDDEATPGYVVIDVNGPNSSSTASYTAAPNFTAALYSMAGDVALTSLADQPNADGYLSIAQFNADGFTLDGTTLGGSQNGVSFGGGDGYFSGGKFTLTGTAGGYNNGTSTYTEQDALAVVCWTGTSATLAAAELAGADIGIFAFENNIGPGGTAPQLPELTGWPTALSPANTANDGFPELILSPAPVPEPATLALAGLGGLSVLLFRRRK